MSNTNPNKKNPYGSEEKIRTARILKKLRENTNGDPRKKKRSAEKLKMELIEKYGNSRAIPVNSRTFTNYEIVNEDKQNFLSGLSMKVETLVLLADFYGVSCDYLLRDEQSNKLNMKEYGLRVGLDKRSISILYKLATIPKYQASYRNILVMLNDIIHSFEDIFEQDKENNNLSQSPFERGYINTLARYLFNDPEPGYYELTYIDDDALTHIIPYPLDASETNAVELVNLQNMLVKSKENYKDFRDARKERLRKLMENKKRGPKKKEAKK